MAGMLAQLGLTELTPTMAAVYLVAVLVLYQVLVWMYQISPFHPLAHIPGPKVARVGRLYEAYWDWFRDGHYTNKIAEMHDRYGPIVRVSHDEVHCNDPYFANTIFGGQHQIRDKPKHFCNLMSTGALPYSGIVTGPHALHRARRAPMSRFFSRAQILRFESEVHRLASLVVDKMLLPERRGRSFDVRNAFNCFAADLVFLHALGKPLGFVEMQEEWTPNLATWTEIIVTMTYVVKHNAFARWLSRVAPGLSGWFSANARALNQLIDVTIPGLLESAADDVDNDHMFPILLRGGRDSKEDAIPGVEMNMFRLGGEATVLLTAGTETSAALMTILTYHILARPDIQAGVSADLAGMDPAALKWTELEKRPYLWALIQETLRHSPPIPTRSTRFAPTEDLVYVPRHGQTMPHGAASLTIPRGFSIGMSAIMNNYDPEIFPDPGQIRPERWLLRDNSSGDIVGVNEELKKYTNTFGRGSRACLGENLAMCEIFMMTAMFVLRVLPRARLDDSMTADYVTYHHERITLQTKHGNVCNRIVIT